MANHCIDVLCLTCGQNWCLRCEQRYTPHTAEQLGARALRNAFRGSGEPGIKEVRTEDQTCVCPAPNVVIE